MVRRRRLRPCLHGISRSGGKGQRSERKWRRGIGRCRDGVCCRWCDGSGSRRHRRHRGGSGGHGRGSRRIARRCDESAWIWPA